MDELLEKQPNRHEFFYKLNKEPFMFCMCLAFRVKTFQSMCPWKQAMNKEMYDAYWFVLQVRIALGLRQLGEGCFDITDGQYADSIIEMSRLQLLVACWQTEPVWISVCNIYNIKGQDTGEHDRGTDGAHISTVNYHMLERVFGIRVVEDKEE